MSDITAARAQELVPINGFTEKLETRWSALGITTSSRSKRKVHHNCAWNCDTIQGMAALALFTLYFMIPPFNFLSLSCINGKKFVQEWK